MTWAETWKWIFESPSNTIIAAIITVIIVKLLWGILRD